MKTSYTQEYLSALYTKASVLGTFPLNEFITAAPMIEDQDGNALLALCFSLNGYTFYGLMIECNELKFWVPTEFANALGQGSEGWYTPLDGTGMNFAPSDTPKYPWVAAAIAVISTEEISMLFAYDDFDGYSSVKVDVKAETTDEESGVQSKAVNFYDQFGNIMYSYTRAEAAALTELPPGPEIEGFEFDTWTKTLAQVQSVEFFADIGPVYKKNGYACAVLVLDIPANDLTANVYLEGTSSSTASKAVIDWGDGESTTNNALRNNYTKFTHTYVSAGIKYVGIYNTGSYMVYLGARDSVYYPSVITDDLEGSTKPHLRISPEFKLLSVLVGASSSIGIYTLNGHQRLKMISSAYETPGYQYHDGITLYFAPALEVIATKYYYRTSGSLLNQVSSLKRFHTGNNTNPTDAFLMHSDAMTDLWITSQESNILPTMNVNRRVIIQRETPPTQNAKTTTIRWGTGLIYVPDSAVETYKTNELFAPVIDCIRPISEYPDY